MDGLYTSKSINVDPRGLLPLAASPNQTPQRGVPEIMPLSWLAWTKRASPASSRSNITKESWPRVHKATGLRIWGPELRARSVSDELYDFEQIIHLFVSQFFSSTKVKYLFGMVSTIPSCTASLYNLTLFWNPRILLKWFHMNSIIISANPLKYIFEILYIHCYHCLEKNITCIQGHKDTYFSFFWLESDH